MSPYIKPVLRPFWNDRMMDIVDHVAETHMPVSDGELNYYVTLLLLRLLKPKSYADYQRIIGLLECIKLEMYRAQVGPYEAIKACENGAVAIGGSN